MIAVRQHRGGVKPEREDGGRRFREWATAAPFGTCVAMYPPLATARLSVEAPRLADLRQPARMGRQVAYAVQFEDSAARAWSAKRRVVRRLGGRDPDDYTLPRRPRGMRRPTYNRLTARYWAAEERLDELVVDVLDRLVRRYGKIYFAA